MKEKIIEALAKQRDTYARLCLNAQKLHCPVTAEFWENKMKAFNDAIGIVTRTH
jgi:hypothetical protein